MGLLHRDSEKVVHGIEGQSSLGKLLRDFFEAYKDRTKAWESTSDNLEVLTAINKLNRKVNEFMATQEERLRALSAQATKIQEGVDRLQSEFEAFKANNPQLEDEIAGLEAAMGALVSDVTPTVTEPTPEPTPTPEG